MDDVTRPRLAVYIDGCNLFNGMREARWRHCYWLDLRELAELLTDDGVSRVVRVVYFTARITGNPEKNKRHSTYISAVQARGGVDVIEGYFQNERVFCGGCKVPFDLPKEKQADTGIATEMVADAFLDRWDKA